MLQSADDFDRLTLAELCKRITISRDIIERYLNATQQGHLLDQAKFQIDWEWLLEDVPAFCAYLLHNNMGRSDGEVAARAIGVTAALWEYASPRNIPTTSGVTQRLGRIRKRLEKLQSRSSPQETGKSVSAQMKGFPFIEAESEYYRALEKVRPDRIRRSGNSVSLLGGRAFSLAEEIAIIDFMIAETAKRRGPRSHARLATVLIEKLEADHQWLTGRSRRQYGARFREFVKAVCESPMSSQISKRSKRNIRARTLIR